ncbi:MAG: L-arabinose isomerase, partial [Acidimicrobiia bacterium]
MKSLDSFEVWFLTGSQGLYGEEVLQQVADNSAAIAGGLDDADDIAVRIVPKPVVSIPEAIEDVCRQANANPGCVGVIAWMHTFSPAKMWIPGLMALD